MGAGVDRVALHVVGFVAGVGVRGIPVGLGVGPEQGTGEIGADLIIGETFYYAGEALAALEVAKASGLPVVLTLAPMAFQEMADARGLSKTNVQKHFAEALGRAKSILTHTGCCE